MKLAGYSRTALTACLLISLACSLSCQTAKLRVAAFYLDVPQPEYSVTADKDVMIPMSDGVRLAADIYHPRTPGRYPAIVVRTPYGKGNPQHKYEFAGRLFASQGFVCLIQDVRGKYASEGEYYPYVNEGRDGHDTFEWAGRQSWSSGKIGTYGFSYFGSTQWLAAPYQSEYLKTMVPIVTSQNPYPRWAYNGIYRYNDVLFWHYGNTCKTNRSLEGIDIDKAVRHLPMIEADDAMGVDISPYNDWIRHPTPDAFWDQIRVDDKVETIKAPALLIDGWYDYYLELMLDDYNRMRTLGGSDEARKSQIIIGPWTHQAHSEFDGVDFGKGADFMQQIKTLLRWYNYWLKGENNGILDEGPIRIFVMGKNEWRTENEWPLKRTRFIDFYLHGGGKANTAQGDGMLSANSPETEPPDRFTYDPENPVPSVGGTSIYGNAVAGPADQRAVEARDDVLVYSTPALEKDMEVTGPITLTLYASSSAPDTDFSGKLVDVYPDGKAIILRAAMIRARYRQSFAEPSFLEAGTVYKFDINVGSTSNVFKKGHRIRLEVSSSNFPEFGRNLNTADPIGMNANIVKADQTIYHDAAHPSHLVLPVIPDEN
ncbi:CocE/NonD family hydrolase [Candidatus Poribacteria bacterium]|nr:CocE/NonD family hydrolase [Candidatus Poribacteria bacterium]